MSIDTNILFHNIKWERIILDEAHEYINSDTKVSSERINTYLHRLKSNYKWICSGTPYTHYQKSWLILSFLCNLYQLYHSPIGYRLTHWYVSKTLIIGITFI